MSHNLKFEETLKSQGLLYDIYDAHQVGNRTTSVKSFYPSRSYPNAKREVPGIC